MKSELKNYRSFDAKSDAELREMALFLRFAEDVGLVYHVIADRMYTSQIRVFWERP